LLMVCVCVCVLRCPLWQHCIGVNDEFYHPDCLTCAVCDKKLEKYISISGSLRCNEHTDVAVDPIQCAVCSKTVEGEVVLSVGMKMHPDCFRCASCKKQLAKVRIIALQIGCAHCACADAASARSFIALAPSGSTH
jgi:hypothetical protein